MWIKLVSVSIIIDLDKFRGRYWWCIFPSISQSYLWIQMENSEPIFCRHWQHVGALFRHLNTRRSRKARTWNLVDRRPSIFVDSWAQVPLPFSQANRNVLFCANIINQVKETYDQQFRREWAIFPSQIQSISLSDITGLIPPVITHTVTDSNVQLPTPHLLFIYDS